MRDVITSPGRVFRRVGLRGVAREQGDGQRLSRRVEPFFYLLPALLILGVVYLGPLTDVIRLSFADAHLLTGFQKWVGLANYSAVLSSEFGSVLVRTLLWVGISVTGSTILGFALALLLNKHIKGGALFRALVILPWLIPESLFAIMWIWVLHSHYGLLNNLLLGLGVIDEGINFLSVSSALPTVILVRIWRGTPFMVMIALAGLQSIPREVEEAAAVDGAGGWQMFRHVTLPLVRPSVLSGVIILAAWTFVIFDLIFVMTGGGPLHATEIASVLIYRQTFEQFELGLASATSLMIMSVVAVMVLFYVRSIRSGER